MLTGSVIRFQRHDVVCLGEMHGVPYVCRVIAATEATWHRADVPLSMAECADAGLRPDVRIRCWPKAGVGGAVIGRLSGVTMGRVIAAVKREAGLRAFEDGWSLRDGRTER
ncbi:MULTISPECIES: hypothetical protein [Acetobacter]|uniref:hypothetical protein n=1 Tax=Acetobacter TaxID=434 RepID=UPI00111D6F75|nr:MULTISPECIES: hypothetical protein [Acetobacter]